MKRIHVVLSVAATLAVSGLVLVLMSSSSAVGADRQTANLEPAAPIERGRYLVHHVGLCIDCHSPRDGQGKYIEALHLTGSALPFAPSVPMPWMPVAPPLAGLPAGFTEEQTVHFLMTGERPHGRPAALPPMPEYRLNREDAHAVASYLHSLGQPSR
jgi:mono/diheme cytochrome c family protein